MFRFCHTPVLALVVFIPFNAWHSCRAQANQQAAPDQPRILRGEQFEEDPQLAAEPEQAILITSESLNPAGRFRLGAGLHRFCLNVAGRYFAGMEVQDALQRPLTTTADQGSCMRTTLPAGVYTIRLLHGENVVPERPEVAEVRADPPVPGAPKLGVDTPAGGGYFNTPIPGYWAIQDTNPLPGSEGINTLRSQQVGPTSTIALEGNDRVLDGYSLFQLPSGKWPEPSPYLNAPQGSCWDNRPSQGQSSYIFVNHYPCKGILSAGLDLLDYRFQYEVNPFGCCGAFAAQIGGQGSYLFQESYNPIRDTLQVLFRYFPDGKQIGNLQNTEVAFYQNCGYSGHAAVFVPLNRGSDGETGLSIFNLSLNHVPGIGFDAYPKSIRLGNNVGVLFTDFSQNPHVVVSDRDCVPLSDSPVTLSIRAKSLLSILTNDRSQLKQACQDCKLAGLQLHFELNSPAGDFSGWNYSGSDFSGASLTNMDLKGATLTDAKFTGASLTSVDLSHIKNTGVVDFSNTTLNGVRFSSAELANVSFKGATLCNVDFSGADSSHLTDLTMADFTGATWPDSKGCESNLSYTRFTPAQLPPQKWKVENIRGAVIANLQSYPLSSQQSPLNLQGVQLAGVSLEHAILDYAQGLSGADMTRIVLNGASLQHVNLNEAKLYGAQLSNVNFDGANLSGAYLTRPPEGSYAAANLQGAFLRNVNLSQARLSGANFTNASFYGVTPAGRETCAVDGNTGFTISCATATGATMDATIFTNAYLFGVDFTGVTAQASQFGNAYLAGANFTGAQLSAGASGANTSFSAAFLQGTNLASINTLDGASLQDAFVDFRPSGNAVTLPLRGEHTTFAGYWNTPGEPVCAQMIYSDPTAVPPATAAVTCPNGSQNAGGCGPPSPDGSNPDWRSSVDITSLASYAETATYTPAAANPLCTPDFRWNNGNLPQPTPGKENHHDQGHQ